jgi:hypothetical protein
MADNLDRCVRACGAPRKPRTYDLTGFLAARNAIARALPTPFRLMRVTKNAPAMLMEISSKRYHVWVDS